MARTPKREREPRSTPLVRRHVVFGWSALFGFALLGFCLEAMHGFKLGWYLDVGNETRRLLLTLAHAHGVLIALVNLAFASTLRGLPTPDAVPGFASPCLLASGVLMPAGFLLGGIVTYGGDPGLGVLLAPVGAALLLAGLGATAFGLVRA